MLIPILFALAASVAAPPSNGASPWPDGVALPAGEPVDEDYRRQFGECDETDQFRGLLVHGCTDDPNAVTALRRLPNGWIAYTSKLAVDLDGSPFACGPDHGRMDQCPTSLMLPADDDQVPVDADRIPYVVIPAAGPEPVRGEFTRLTGVKVGDFGVVIANGRVVPVLVADTGPFAKLGEGSLALHRALGRELCAERDAAGICVRVVEPMESIGGEVTTVLFPGSARLGASPDSIAKLIRSEGTRIWNERAQQLGVVPSVGAETAYR